MMKHMISHTHKLVLATALLALPLASHAAPSKAINAVPEEKIRSTFVIPKAPEDGRDPFFPKATSLYQKATISIPVVDSGINFLKVTGISGSSFAQINNVTLSVGETEEVKTSSGSVAVRLLEIHSADSSVVVEASGQRRVLRFNTK
jgi:hypothetical protein